MSSQLWVTALRSAAVCEVVWLTTDGRARAVAATPLALDDRPVLAFAYAHAEVAREIGAARQAAIVLSDRRMAGSGWQPLAVIGRPEVTEDREGSLFTDALLDQELRKHPPSRALADSILLRREHWWFLPRIVVAVEPDAVIPMAPRQGGAADAVLGVSEMYDSGERLRVATVGMGSAENARFSVLPLGEGSLLGNDATPRPAVLLRHDFSVPDVERWSSWTAFGNLTDDVLDSADQRGSVVLPPPLGLLARIRRQRMLARACRKALQ